MKLTPHKTVSRTLQSKNKYNKPLIMDGNLAMNSHFENMSEKDMQDMAEHYEIKSPIEDALYSTKRFLTSEASELAEGIMAYLKDAGFKIVAIKEG